MRRSEERGGGDENQPRVLRSETVQWTSGRGVRRFRRHVAKFVPDSGNSCDAVNSSDKAPFVGNQGDASESSYSASVIAANKDLLTLILLCLPLKSLVQFKLVSKQWLSMISNLRRRRWRHDLVTCKSIYNVVPLDLNSSAVIKTTPTFDENRDREFRILQSCNGLLLLCVWFNYFIYNLATGKCVRLPDFATRQILYAANLAFNPRKSPHFKVLCVHSRKMEEYPLVMYVYSSELGTWKHISSPSFVDVQFNCGVFWNGAINWFSCHSGDGLYLNLDEERFVTLPMPPIPNRCEQRGVRYFGESNDHLHLVEIYGPLTTEFNIYEMDTKYSGWTVRYRVDIKPVMNAFREPISGWLGPSILSIVRRRHSNESFIVLSIPGKVIRYDLDDKSFETIWTFESKFDRPLPVFGWPDSFEYVECISSVSI